MLRKEIKYLMVTLSSNVILYISTFLLVSSGFESKYAFSISLTAVYIGIYLANVFFVFNVTTSGNNAMRYIVYLVVFWILNNILFNSMIELLNIHYLVAMIINIILAIILLNRLGVRGLALAVSISGIVQFVLLIRPYRKIFVDLSSFIIHLILISIIAAMPVIYIQKVSGYVLSFILGGPVFVLIFICLGYILKIEEICRILKKSKNR